MTPSPQRISRIERARLGRLLAFERKLWNAGSIHVAGADEVGLGPLAGPVVAAAVILPRDIEIARIDDSKRLDAATREQLEPEIRARAIAFSVAVVEVAEFDRFNIYEAGLEALARAIRGLGVTPDHALVDARHVPGLGRMPQTAIIKGDSLSYSIACASIIAKVFRDRLMTELGVRYPAYGFETHKGYGTAAHIRAIQEHGPSPVHRMSWGALAEIVGKATPQFYQLRDQIAAAIGLDDLESTSARLKRVRTDLKASEAQKLSALLLRRRRRLAQLRDRSHQP